MFFAPGHKVAGGFAEMARRLPQDWRGLAEFARSWLRVSHYVGSDRIEAGYAATLDGAMAPSGGMIMSFAAQSSL